MNVVYVSGFRDLISIQALIYQEVMTNYGDAYATLENTNHTHDQGLEQEMPVDV